MRAIFVAVAFAGLITSAAAGADARRSAPQPFELVVVGEHETVPAGSAFPFGTRHRGTFVANPPFCSSGVFWDLTNDLLNSFQDTRLYTCDDRSGTLTTVQEDWFEHKPPFTSSWRIDDGTGRYADLRGGGTYRGELLEGNDEDPLSVRYRSTYRGVVAFDAIAPTISISSAKSTRLRRPAGRYAIRVTFSLRDNQPQTRLAYFVAVEPAGGGLYIADRRGSAAPGKVTVTLIANPARAAVKVLLHLRAEDAVGNWRWVTRSVKLR